MSIEIGNETPAPIDVEEVRKLAGHVMSEMRIHPQAELAVRFVDEATMSELHVQWMDLEGPTDVMSFPMDELRPDGEEGMLGDIVICPAVAQAQATQAGHSLMDEVQLLCVHGLLHLIGYDHAEPEEKRVMFDLQRRLLLTWFAKRDPQRTSLPTPTED